MDIGARNRSSTSGNLQLPDVDELGKFPDVDEPGKFPDVDEPGPIDISRYIPTIPLSMNSNFFNNLISLKANDPN